MSCWIVLECDAREQGNNIEETVEKARFPNINAASLLWTWRSDLVIPFQARLIKIKGIEINSLLKKYQYPTFYKARGLMLFNRRTILDFSELDRSITEAS